MQIGARACTRARGRVRHLLINLGIPPVLNTTIAHKSFQRCFTILFICKSQFRRLSVSLYLLPGPANHADCRNL